MTRLDDPQHVVAEYASERGLAARKAAYRLAEGPDARQIAFEAVAEAEPARVLEVGCGEGELAERIGRELGAKVVAVDQSERMVELTRRRGVEALVGDVQELPFGASEFDCAVAAWMLYHVPDVERALVELARVIRPAGRLVAVTNARDHLGELLDLLGVERPVTTFSAENGEALLARRFSRVERREAYGWVDFPDRGAVENYLTHSSWLSACELPPDFDGALRARRAPVVFVAER